MFSIVKSLDEFLVIKNGKIVAYCKTFKEAEAVLYSMLKKK